MSLVVVRAAGLVSVQDLGRRGHMHEAVPPGGALVPELLVVANRAAHNPAGAAAIEVVGRLVVRAEREVTVATDREPRRTLAAGDELAIASEPRRATYLAVRGGVAAPLVLDGRGTLLCARLGALVRAGERIHAAGLAAHRRRPRRTAAVADPDTFGDVGSVPDVDHSEDTPVPDAVEIFADESDTDEPADIDLRIAAFGHAGPIRLIAGPDPDAFEAGALDALVAAPYTISPASDRTGTRLVGAALPRRAAYREVSRPMCAGAIEVPRDGVPIVLGPEHPTTGGYPVVAVIAAADLGRFFAIRIGGSVAFTCRS